MEEHVYILKGFEDQEDRVFLSEKELPKPEVMFLLMDQGAEWCEIYKTNGFASQDQWELKSILGSSVGFGIFDSLKANKN